MDDRQDRIGFPDKIEFQKANIDTIKNIFHKFNYCISGTVEWFFYLFTVARYWQIIQKTTALQKQAMEETPEKLIKKLIEAKLKEERE